MEVDPKYYRPTEVVSLATIYRIQLQWYNCQCYVQDLLLGDASKAKRELGWIPKTRFKVCWMECEWNVQTYVLLYQDPRLYEVAESP